MHNLMKLASIFVLEHLQVFKNLMIQLNVFILNVLIKNKNNILKINCEKEI